MSDPLDHLDATGVEAWQQFKHCEQAGLRAAMLTALRDFIAIVNGYPPPQRRLWVEALCNMHWGVSRFPQGIEGTLMLRHPLLVEVVYPELLEGYREGRPGYARWLTLFTLTPSGGIDGRAYVELRLRGMPDSYPGALAREALRLEPANEQALHALLLYLTYQFAYWTHEVPRGVLTDDTAAWRADLDEFEQLIEHYGSAGRDYSADLAFWRFHCDAWEDYLEHSHQHANYEEFLQSRAG